MDHQDLEKPEVWPDGLYHTADGKKWFPDNGLEVRAANQIYAKTKTKLTQNGAEDWNPPLIPKKDRTDDNIKADGLYHTPDGKRWHTDTFQEVRGVN